MTDYPRVRWNTEDYLRFVRSACFICELVAGNPDYPHDVAHQDDDGIVFLSRWPWLLGHVLVAPVRHREQVVGDFPVAEYLCLQRVVHATGRALAEVVPTERLYVLSLGSQQGNRHVHWHLVPLPPGVPYEEQQLAALSHEQGYLDVPPAVQTDLAARLAARLGGPVG
jgi:diadenosine tetraphosphate (Ap4A) HIT family hydrolase